MNMAKFTYTVLRKTLEVYDELCPICEDVLQVVIYGCSTPREVIGLSEGLICLGCGGEFSKPPAV